MATDLSICFALALAIRPHSTNRNPFSSTILPITQPLIPLSLLSLFLAEELALDGTRPVLPAPEPKPSMLIPLALFAELFSCQESKLTSPISRQFLAAPSSPNISNGTALSNNATRKLTSCSSSMSLDLSMLHLGPPLSNLVLKLPVLTLSDQTTLLWVWLHSQPLQD
jgi:hypothetical protein